METDEIAPAKPVELFWKDKAAGGFECAIFQNSGKISWPSFWQ